MSETDDWARVWGRMKNPEDGLTERKPEGAGSSDFKETIVAFSNSVPEGALGVLFVGVANSGEVLGCGGVESLEKSIARICENDCYPPITIRFECRAMDEGKPVLAVIVPHSTRRPHFAGHAFQRVGSQNRKADEPLYAEFIAARSTVGAKILANKGNVVQIKTVGKKLGNPAPLPPNYSEGGKFVIRDCDTHTVTLENISTNVRCVEQLENFSISADAAGQLLLLVRESRR